MRWKVGEEVIVKRNNLYRSDEEFGTDSYMKSMRGNTYTIERVGSRGLMINQYWFSFDDLVNPNAIEDKPEQIVHFNADELNI